MLQRVQAERGDRGGVRDGRKCRRRRIPRAGGRRRDRRLVKVGAVGELVTRSYRSSKRRCLLLGVASVGRLLFAGRSPAGSAGRTRPGREARALCGRLLALPASGASSTALRWCFPGRPATSTSANPRFLATRPAIWRCESTPAGCVPGTSQAKNRKATTTMIRPRPSPNRKPSVRSSAPMRLSSTMSENRTVMIDTISSVQRKTPPTTSAGGDRCRC